MTKADLLNLLEPYASSEEVVFVSFDDGVVVHEDVSVAKDHSTTRTMPDGAVFMPVAIYLVDAGKQGKPGVLGADAKDIIPRGWPKPGDEPPGAQAGATALRDLLLALLETAQAIAAEPDDPMHESLSAAGNIDSVVPEGGDAVVIATGNGRRFRVSIAEAP